MKSNKEGHIINISSRAGKYGFPGSGIYSASKFGLNGLTESLYREYVSTGVKVTTICPGWVNTDMAFEANSPYKAAEMIQPEDIVKAVKFLLDLSGPTCIKELVIESSKSIL